MAVTLQNRHRIVPKNPGAEKRSHRGHTWGAVIGAVGSVAGALIGKNAADDQSSAAVQIAQTNAASATAIAQAQADAARLAAATSQAQATQAQATNKQYLMYGGIAAGALVLVMMFAFMMKK